MVAAAAAAGSAAYSCDLACSSEDLDCTSENELAEHSLARNSGAGSDDELETIRTGDGAAGGSSAGDDDCSCSKDTDQLKLPQYPWRPKKS